MSKRHFSIHLSATIYLKRPPGLSPDIMPPIVKLNKCIYGLKQEAHEWRQLLDVSIKFFGFQQLKTDACTYKISKLFNKTIHQLFLEIFVDDTLCLGTSSQIIHWFKMKWKIYLQ